MTLPLENLKVIDLSRVLAGPLAAMILGDLGADVIKVERPGSGDDTRGWGPPFDDRGESAYYLSANRNKISVAADFKDPADHALIERLMRDADVVIENFRAGTLERHGLGPSAMLAKHPRLIWCTITGFGLASRRPGYDLVVQAESGWMSIAGEPDGVPMKAPVAFVDVLAGKDAAIAILAALAGGRRGERHVVASLLHGATAALVNVAQNALVTGTEPRRWGNEHPNLVPYQLLHAQDRAMVIAVGSDAQWRACVRALGLDALAEDPALATNAGRVAARDVVTAALGDALKARPAAEWCARLDAVGVPCGVVKPVLEALEAVAASGLSGVVPQHPGRVRRPPPQLDEHGAAVRADGWAVFLRDAS